MSDKLKTDRPGWLVCVCDRRGNILLDAPYDYEEPPVGGKPHPSRLTPCHLPLTGEGRRERQTGKADGEG